MSLDVELEELAAFSETQSPTIKRLVFSKEDVAARAWFKQTCLAAGFNLREDAIGNTFVRWEGSDASAAPVATGSHIDAIPNAGRFDGTVGVLGGLEAMRRLKASGFLPRRSIELILFTSEEPTRFGIGCLGSRMISGILTAERARLIAGLDELRLAAGFHGDLENVQLSAGYYAAFVELHIEQGPLLEAEKIDIGIVTSIAAPAALRITLTGSGGHAGAVLMKARKDAFVGAAEIAIAVESAALSTGSEDSVATTGICNVFPGAVNSVPSKVKLEVDVRDSDLLRRDGMVAEIQRRCYEIAERRKLEISLEIVNSDAPATCDLAIVEAISAACVGLGLSHRRIVSRAYHDTLFMSRITPAAMIFIPCRLGISHRPDEFASGPDIENGVAVLARTLAVLAA